MNIGIDIDDTITRNLDFFSFLTKMLVDAGHKVVIITIREDRVKTANFLKELGISYTHLETSSLDAEAEYGNSWKGSICEKHNIEVFFEDKPEIIKRVNPKTLSFMAVDQQLYDLDKIADPFNLM